LIKHGGNVSKRGGSDKLLPLHIACEFGDLKRVKKLISYGTNYLSPSLLNQKPVSFASFNKCEKKQTTNYELFCAFESKKFK